MGRFASLIFRRFGGIFDDAHPKGALGGKPLKDAEQSAVTAFATQMLGVSRSLVGTRPMGRK